MIYEWRVYEILPNRMPAINHRFAKVTLRLFQKYDMRVVGFWQTEVGANNELVYLLQFDDLAHRERAWNAFRGDPEWRQAQADSEKDGPIVARVVNSILRPTPYSPLQ